MKWNNALTPAYLMICCCMVFPTAGCRKSDRGHWETYKTTIYTPILLSKADVFSSINGNPNQTIDSTGRIYVQGNHIFLNEVDKGIHVIDNSDPAHPVQTAFLKIPGNLDIAIESGILYADMYSHLLAINIADIHHVRIVADLPNIFTGRSFNSDSADIVTGYTSKDTLIRQLVYPETDRNQTYQSSWTNAAKSGSPGKAGSMARMVLMNKYLYAVAEGHSISIVDVRDASHPAMLSIFGAGFDLETIFPLENTLFLGSATGMYMLDLSDPENPVSLGTFSHGRACDPVVADGKYAYVTLHAGTNCGGFANELHIIDITDLHNPSLVKSYPMTRPGGLSKDGHVLLVCDGDTEVKLFDASNPGRITYLSELTCEQPYDVITGSNKAIVVAKRGIYQFDYTDPHHPRQISFIHTGNK